MRGASERRAVTGLRRFKPYPEYKDSGVEWLGEIPAHWEAKRLKHLAHIASGLAPPDSFDRLAGEYPVYGSNGLIGYCDQFLIAQETLAVGRVGASGSVNAIPPRSWVSDNALLLRDLKPSLKLAWLRYVLEAMDLPSQAAKNAQPIITGTFVGNHILAAPPLDERRAITAFLDRETAKIDALVAKKQHVIELLEEKRTALITRAVTRGLDPNVPMKDSGVEWLGEIPAHWNVKRLKRVTKYIEGPGIMAVDFALDGVPLLRISSLGTRYATLNGCNFLSAELVETRWRHHRVKRGDLLISGSASTGFCSEVNAETEGAVPYTGIIIIRVEEETSDRDFTRWFLLSPLFGTQIDLARSGSTIQHFGPTHLSRMLAVVPPLDEQRAIATFLDQETAEIDALVARVRDAVDRLKELRTALITAAVTGKIDVREETA